MMGEKVFRHDTYSYSPECPYMELLTMSSNQHITQFTVNGQLLVVQPTLVVAKQWTVPVVLHSLNHFSPSFIFLQILTVKNVSLDVTVKDFMKKVDQGIRASSEAFLSTPQQNYKGLLNSGWWEDEDHGNRLSYLFSLLRVFQTYSWLVIKPRIRKRLSREQQKTSRQAVELSYEVASNFHGQVTHYCEDISPIFIPFRILAIPSNKVCNLALVIICMFYCATEIERSSLPPPFKKNEFGNTFVAEVNYSKDLSVVCYIQIA